MTSPINVRCDNCRFWSEAERGDYLGECRRRAPIKQKEIICGRDYWCGEFEGGKSPTDAWRELYEIKYAKYERKR